MLQVSNTTQLLQNFVQNYGVPPGQSSQVYKLLSQLHSGVSMHVTAVAQLPFEYIFSICYDVSPYLYSLFSNCEAWHDCGKSPYL